MPIFRVESVKIFTGKKKLHGYTRGARDKYQVWFDRDNLWTFLQARCSRRPFGCSCLSNKDVGLKIKQNAPIKTNYWAHNPKLLQKFLTLHVLLSALIKSHKAQFMWFFWSPHFLAWLFNLNSGFDPVQSENSKYLRKSNIRYVTHISVNKFIQTYKAKLL